MRTLVAECLGADPGNLDGLATVLSKMSKAGRALRLLIADLDGNGGELARSILSWYPGNGSKYAARIRDFHSLDHEIEVSKPDAVLAACSPAQYHRFARMLRDCVEREPTLILPYVGPDGTFKLNLGGRSPLVLHLSGQCGSNRVRPTLDALFGYLQKDYFAVPEYHRHARLVEKVARNAGADGGGFGTNLISLEMIEEHYRHAVTLLDYDCYTFVHACVSPAVYAVHDDVQVVFLIRDPRDMFVSAYHWYISQNMFVGGERLAALRDLPKEEGLSMLLGGMEVVQPHRHYIFKHPPLKKLATDFLHASRQANVFLLKFEDVRLDPAPTYRRLLEWLDLHQCTLRPISDEMLAQAISFGSFEFLSGGKMKEGQGEQYVVDSGTSTPLRKGIVGDWKNHFSPALKSRVKQEMGDVLIELGYEKDFDW